MASGPGRAAPPQAACPLPWGEGVLQAFSLISAKIADISVEANRVEGSSLVLQDKAVCFQACDPGSTGMLRLGREVR